MDRRLLAWFFKAFHERGLDGSELGVKFDFAAV